ncbi:MAG: hypothetical protein K0V04_34495 [Deltaproteobacteria bacterium]|nr:hypothetical protein [Deltaproteobacteria bacterium]
MLHHELTTHPSIALLGALLALGCSPEVGGSGEPGIDGSETGTETSTPSMTSTDGVDDSASSSGELPFACGNGLVEPGEQCDGLELGGFGCRDINPSLVDGALACSADCTFDATGCITIPNPVQICQISGGEILDYMTLAETIVLPPDLRGRTIVDVDVHVELDHSYLGDLLIEVLHDDTAVVLQDGCASANNLHVIYDSEAKQDVVCPQSDGGLAFLPLGDLTAFDGMALGSGWTLRVEDRSAYDTGVLEQWCVSVSWR